MVSEAVVGGGRRVDALPSATKTGEAESALPPSVIEAPSKRAGSTRLDDNAFKQARVPLHQVVDELCRSEYD